MFRKIAKVLLGLSVLLMLLLFVWYQIDGLPADESAAFLSGNGFTVAENDNGELVFTPANPNGYGIVIMHGALIKPQSYSKSAAYFAERGYTVYLPNGPARLSIGAVDQAAARLQDFKVSDWFFIGHSMGGMASLELITKHDVAAKGVALWAAAMPSDYSGREIPILFIWGDNDGLLPEARFNAGKLNLPESTSYVTLQGANHKNFALYTHQFFDNEAEIDWDKQIDFANEATADFFTGLQ